MSDDVERQRHRNTTKEVKLALYQVLARRTGNGGAEQWGERGDKDEASSLSLFGDEMVGVEREKTRVSRSERTWRRFCTPA